LHAPQPTIKGTRQQRVLFYFTRNGKNRAARGKLECDVTKLRTHAESQ